MTMPLFDVPLSLASGTDAMLVHQTTYPLLSDTVTTGHQFFPNFWPTVFLPDLCMDDSDFNQQAFVAHTAR